MAFHKAQQKSSLPLDSRIFTPALNYYAPAALTSSQLPLRALAQASSSQRTGLPLLIRVIFLILYTFTQMFQWKHQWKSCPPMRTPCMFFIIFIINYNYVYFSIFLNIGFFFSYQTIGPRKAERGLVSSLLYFQGLAK